MRQYFAKHPVCKGSSYCTCNNYNEHRETRSKQSKHRAWTCTSERPAKTKDDTAKNIALVGLCLILESNRFTLIIGHIASLDVLNEYHPEYNRRANNPIHMKALKAEHLINAEPANDLRFYRDNSKEQTNREKFKNGYHTFKRPNKKLA